MIKSLDSSENDNKKLNLRSINFATARNDAHDSSGPESQAPGWPSAIQILSIKLHLFEFQKLKSFTEPASGLSLR